MPVSLFLYLYRNHQKRIQEAFDRNNKILSPKDIDELFQKDDRALAVKILRSAVVDHASVDGMPYHLAYPGSGLFYHDYFKKAFIADELGNYFLPFTENEFKDVQMILNHLIDIDSSPGYVQIFAWNTLGKICRQHPCGIQNFHKKVLSALGASAASVLGALLFVDQCLQTSMRHQAEQWLKEGAKLTCYRVQKVLMNYYRSQQPGLKQGENFDIKLESDIKKFFISLNKGYHLGESDFIEGCREIGLIQRTQQPKLWKTTEQFKVARRLEKVCGKYLSVIGAFLRQ